MVKSACALLPMLALCAGCLFSSSAPEVKTWTVAHRMGGSVGGGAKGRARQLFDTTRVGPVVVDAPYHRIQFSLQRADGSVATDYYNTFVSPPSELLRGALRDNLVESGRFGHVVTQGSVAAADAQVEVQVQDLSLRRGGDASAPLETRVALKMDIVRTGRGPRSVMCSLRGDACCEVEAGNYSAAFSKAFNRAVQMALMKIPDPPRAEANVGDRGR